MDPLIKSQLLYQLSYAPALLSRGPPRRGRLPKRRRAVHPSESRPLGPRPEERGRQTARLEGRTRRTASRQSFATLAPQDEVGACGGGNLCTPLNNANRRATGPAAHDGAAITGGGGRGGDRGRRTTRLRRRLRRAGSRVHRAHPCHADPSFPCRADPSSSPFHADPSRNVDAAP